MCVVLSYFIFYGLLSEINLDDDDNTELKLCVRFQRAQLS